jgi:hypothetical protein
MSIKTFIVEPKWVRLSDGVDEAEFLIKPVGYNVYNPAIRAVLKEYGNKDANEKHPEAELTDEEKELINSRWLKFCELIAPKALIGWREVNDHDGQPIPFSVDIAISCLNDNLWAQIINESLKEIHQAELKFRRSPSPA